MSQSTEFMATVTNITQNIYLMYVLGASAINQVVVQRRAVQHAGIGVIERHRADGVRDPVRKLSVSAVPPAQRCQLRIYEKVDLDLSNS